MLYNSHNLIGLVKAAEQPIQVSLNPTPNFSIGENVSNLTRLTPARPAAEQVSFNSTPDLSISRESVDALTHPLQKNPAPGMISGAIGGVRDAIGSGLEGLESRRNAEPQGNASEGMLPSQGQLGGSITGAAGNDPESLIRSTTTAPKADTSWTSTNPLTNPSNPTSTQSGLGTAPQTAATSQPAQTQQTASTSQPAQPAQSQQAKYDPSKITRAQMRQYAKYTGARNMNSDMDRWKTWQAMQGNRNASNADYYKFKKSASVGSAMLAALRG